MRTLLIALAVTLATALAGCTTACKDHTLLVTVKLGGPAAGADTLALTISIDGGPGRPAQVMLAQGATGGTVEIDFPSGYPSGKTVTVSAQALHAGAVLAQASAAANLSGSCANLTLAFTSGTDGGGGDGMVDGGDAGTQCLPHPCDGGTGLCGGCALFALESEVASTSDTVTLEGQFAASATVTFPGGATANATVLGPGRAQVVVPPSAGEGLLSVSTGGVTTLAQPFRRASFVVGLGTFRSAYEQADYGRQMPQLSGWGSAAVSDGRHLWVLGGGGEGATDAVQEALIDADGTLTGFTTLATKLTTKRTLLTAVRIGYQVYVIGGRDQNGAALSSVEVASIGPNGTLGPFQVVQGLSLTTARWAHASVVAGRFLYVLGGYTGPKCGPPAALATVERAPINPDSSLGAFADTGLTLTTTRSSLAAVVAGSSLYAIGGDGNSSTTIDMAAIAPDGTIGAFKSAIGVLPSGRAAAAAFALGGKLYVVGGFYDGGNPPASYVAPINLDGTLGTFATASPSPGGPYAASAIVGDYLYTLAGGWSLCCGACAAAQGGGVWRASLDVGAGPGPFSLAPAAELKSPRNSFSLVAIGPYVYAIGGQMSGQPDVERATVQPDGTLGGFAAVAGETLATPRAGAAAAIAGSWLYIAGGQTLSGGTLLGSVEAAPIAADGSLGAFALAKANGSGAPVTLVMPRTGLTLLALGSKLCMLGGGVSSGPVKLVDCVAINADGTLAGSFATDLTASLDNVHIFGPASVVTGENAYVVGGTENGGGSDVAPLDTTGYFSGGFATVSLGINSQSGQSGFVAGDKLFLAGGMDQLADYFRTIVVSPIDPTAGTLSTLTAATNSLMFSSSLQRNLVIGNHVYMLGGNGGGSPAQAESAELR